MENRCHRLLLALVVIISATRATSLAAAAPAAAPAPASGTQPENFKYTQLWSDAEGETHIAECKMQGFREEAYSALLQFVRDDFGGNATKMVFTELSVNLTQPLHNTPSTQFVITLSGSWYIKTTDGSYREFLPGEVLFQDNTKDSPAAKSPQHYSGAVGDVPCQQFVIQFDRVPNVNVVCPF
ncbi:hypothetical protein L7F22_048328 [Adiantum nelumboides]|nr:hypothetical protein [Adiantum nelumboides]